MRTLTARLVATTLVLVALAAVGIGAATTVVMRSYLMDRLDHDVVDSLARAARPGLGPSLDMAPGGGPAFVRGQAIGTLTAVITSDGTVAGVVLTARGRGMAGDAPVPPMALERLAEVDADGRPRTARLDGLGDYRVAAVDLPNGRLISGLPQARVDDAWRRRALGDRARHADTRRGRRRRGPGGPSSTGTAPRRRNHG